MWSALKDFHCHWHKHRSTQHSRRRDEEQTFANYDSIILWMDPVRVQVEARPQCSAHTHIISLILRALQLLICLKHKYKTRTVRRNEPPERTANLTRAHRDDARMLCAPSRFFSHEHVDFFAYFHIYYSYFFLSCEPFILCFFSLFRTVMAMAFGIESTIHHPSSIERESRLDNCNNEERQEFAENFNFLAENISPARERDNPVLMESKT